MKNVLWLFDDLGLESDRIDRGGEHGGLDDPAFRALNPNGRILVVVDGPVLLWESYGILRHYCRMHADAGLWPQDAGEAARADMMIDFAANEFWPLLRPPYPMVWWKGARRAIPR